MTDSLPALIAEVTARVRHYFVENERSARRFLRAVDPSFDIDGCEFSVVSVSDAPDLGLLGRWIAGGLEVGVISEAGYPCIADPGEWVVREAHRIGAQVVPLPGPNAMLMALAASGLNGEQFRFSGYLPRQSSDRVRSLRQLEKRALESGETQLFMETPYRNNQLLHDMVENLRPTTQLCIAVDITAPSEYIETRSIGDWARQAPDLHKRPAVFLLGAP